MSAGLREGRYFQRGLVPMKCLKRSCGVVLLSAMDFPGGSDGKESAYNAGDPGSIPGSGRSPGEGSGNPLQYSCLGNPMDGGAWWATVCGVAKSQTLNDFTYVCLECRIGQCCLWLRSQPFLHPCEDWETHTGPSQVNRMASWELHEGLFCGRK